MLLCYIMHTYMAQNGIEIRNQIKALVESSVATMLESKPEALAMLPRITIDRPADTNRGDYSTNIALATAKTIDMSPVEFAVQLAAIIELKIHQDNATGGVNLGDGTSHEGVATDDDNSSGATESEILKVEVAGAGFINFYLKPEVAADAVLLASKKESLGEFGKISTNTGKKIAYEYTDPNPFKVFHVGHLMANTVGESLSRLGGYTGAEIKRFCYQGDIGRHVALFVYGLRLMDEPFPTEKDVEDKKLSLVDRMYFMGKSYAKGSTYFKEHPEVEEEVQTINKKLYDKSDEEINQIYNLGLEWSLEYFETLYVRLGTKFDQYFFESACVPPALALISGGKARGIFTESEGAIIFEGEKFQEETKEENIGEINKGEKSKVEKLHTRVFITKFGLPTYDAKELGLAKLKYEAFEYDKGIVITANEQDQYFKVNLKVQSLMIPETTGKNTHVSHGMMVLPTGKMSSRTGDVVSAEEMLEQARTYVLEVMKNRDMSAEEKEKISDQIAIAGIKYLVLRQATGKDVIYDAKKALSFEGDSGPYLQYACVRARTVIAKALAQGIVASETFPSDHEVTIPLAKKISIFQEIVERAYYENAPHHIATYLIELSALFNNFYANNKIIDVTDDVTRARSSELLTLTQAVANVLENGLYLLGISVPAKM